MDVTFEYFFQQIFSSPALLITSLLTLGVIFVNGWTDAPNAIATCITTRCMRPRPAILMSAVFNFLGVLIMTKINASVASTISNMVDFGNDTSTALLALSAALFSIVVYSTAASYFGFRHTDKREPQSYRRIDRCSHRFRKGTCGCKWLRVDQSHLRTCPFAHTRFCNRICCMPPCGNHMQKDEQAENESVLQLRSDSRSCMHELHAWCPGWTEIHRSTFSGYRIL